MSIVHHSVDSILVEVIDDDICSFTTSDNLFAASRELDRHKSWSAVPATLVVVVILKPKGLMRSVQRHQVHQMNP